MVNQPDPFDETKIAEFYPILGQIIIAWSRIERAIDLAIWAVRRPDISTGRDGQPYVAFKPKLTALRKICRESMQADGAGKSTQRLIDRIHAVSAALRGVVQIVEHCTYGQSYEQCFRAA